MPRPAPPFHFQRWIDEHRHLLRPPVGNAAVWEDREFMVTVVGGPNARSDFHINQGEEFFYQLEGDINLLMLVDGVKEDFFIREGEIFLLPGGVPHSPQRPAGTIGLVIERRRRPGELDGFLWVCDGCGARLHLAELAVTSIVTDLPPVFDRFWGDPSLTTCRACGRRHERTRPQG